MLIKHVTPFAFWRVWDLGTYAVFYFANGQTLYDFGH